MKKEMILGLVLVLFVMQIVAVRGEYTTQDVLGMLRSSSDLVTFKDKVNGALDGVPAIIRSVLLGSDRVYLGRISSGKVGIVLRNDRITDIYPGTPDNPTHYLDTDFQTVANLLNAENPTNVVVDAIVNNKIRVSEVPDCTSDIQCADNQVCHQGSCKRAFTVVVVPIGYGSGEFDDFYSKAKAEMDLFRQFTPTNKDLIRIHYVNPSVCPDYQCSDVCRDCQNTASSCASNAGFAGVADKVAGVSKDDVKVYLGNNEWLLLCGCAGGIPSYTSVSRSRLYVEQGVYCYNTVPHEMGHQLGLYHVDASGDEAGACQGPNANDCNEADKASDIMGYAWPQDHYGPAAVNYVASQWGWLNA